MLKIGFDIQGGDGSAEDAFQGLKQYIHQNNEVFVNVYLTEDYELVEELKTLTHVELIFCKELINHHDSMLEIRRKKESTLVRAMNDLKEGKIEGLISAGASGPLVTAGYLILKPISKVLKPAFSASVVGPDDRLRLVMDVGANIDFTPENLLGFAYMGKQYFSSVIKNQNPKVGLLNVGKETKKGTKQHQQAHNLLLENEDINFIGNIEPNEVMTADYDVLVTDGFTGNVLLKSYEGAFKIVKDLMKQSANESLKVKLGLGLAKELYTRFQGLTKNKYVGAATVFGLSKPLIKVHGSADQEQYEAAFSILERVIKDKLVDKLKDVEIKTAEQIENDGGE